MESKRCRFNEQHQAFDQMKVEGWTNQQDDHSGNNLLRKLESKLHCPAVKQKIVQHEPFHERRPHYAKHLRHSQGNQSIEKSCRIIINQNAKIKKENAFSLRLKDSCQQHPLRTIKSTLRLTRYEFDNKASKKRLHNVSHSHFPVHQKNEKRANGNIIQKTDQTKTFTNNTEKVKLQSKSKGPESKKKIILKKLEDIWIEKKRPQNSKIINKRSIFNDIKLLQPVDKTDRAPEKLKQSFLPEGIVNPLKLRQGERSFWKKRQNQKSPNYSKKVHKFSPQQNKLKQILKMQDKINIRKS